MSYLFVREPLSREECDRMVNACRSFREKLIVWVLLDTGLRVSEFSKLRREQIHWQENCLVIWGKGGWYGQRVQNSVFECLVDPAQWTAMRQRLIDEIDPERDSLRFYFLGANWKRRVEHIGAKPAYDPQGPLIV